MPVLLDSDMPCDVKRIFFPSTNEDGRSFCMQSDDVLPHAAVKYPPEKIVSQGGSGSGVTPGHWWMLFWHSSLQKQMWTLFKYDHSHWRLHGVSLFFLISVVLHQCLLINMLPKKLGEHQFIILLDLKMNILFHEHVMEPKECVNNHIIKYDWRNMVFSLSNPSVG